MEKWEQFEFNSIEYLNGKLNELGFQCTGTGGKNSNSSDIAILKDGKFIFNIEAKLSPSQSGQIVIIKKDDNYEISEKSKSDNSNSKKIIENINVNFETYNKNNPKYFELNLIDKQIIYDWVKEHYTNKKSYFIITSTSLNSFYSIIPIDEINKFFTISGVVRIKRSGTRYVPLKDIDKVKILVDNHFNSIAITNFEISLNDKKLIIKLNNNLKLKSADRYFNEYYLSPIENYPDEFYIKVRSNTCNLNIVFSLQYIGSKDFFGLDDLIKKLQND